MQEGFRFVGAGDDGNRKAIELSRIYEGLRDGLFYEEHDEPQNHLHIHSFPFAETVCLDWDHQAVILAGSVRDPCWQEARNAVHESRAFLMLTIGIDHEQAISLDAFQPFPNECLVFPDPSLFDPVELAKLVLEIFLMHTSWQVCSRGSLVGYDFVDTKNVLAGKVAKASKMTSVKEHCRQNFSRFLLTNKADICRTQGILMSFWGRDDVLSIPKVDELWTETIGLLMPDADQVFTYHVLPEGEQAFMAQHHLVAHNASFDRRFLDAELNRINKQRKQEFACSMLVSRRLYPEAPSHSLGTLVRYKKLKTGGVYHRALADAEMTGHLWISMINDLKRDYRFRTVPFDLMQRLSKVPKATAPAFLKGLAGELG